MTLPGPSRTIIVQPVEEPAPPERVPDSDPAPERDAPGERPQREPARERPEREPVEVP